MTADRSWLAGLRTPNSMCSDSGWSASSSRSSGSPHASLPNSQATRPASSWSAANRSATSPQCGDPELTNELILLFLGNVMEVRS